MLIDSHAHLDGDRFSSDLPKVLDRAETAGVGQILCIACATPETASLDRVLELVEEWPQLYAALGVHPHDASKATPLLLDRIARLMTHPKVLAWGEIGLDHYYDNAPQETQLRIFEWQLTAAREAAKPVIIHSRDAAHETCSALEKEAKKGSLQGVMHCFTYGQDTADACADLGFHLGFGGILTFPRSEQLRSVAAQISSQRYLIETDSPYLAPIPLRGKRNEPAFVVEVAQKLAEVRGISPLEVARQTTANFNRLFQPPP